MGQIFHIHPDNPQQRLIQDAVDIVQKGGVIVYPTDAGYSMGCHLNDKDALERIKVIRQLNDEHFFTLVCRDLSSIATYARIDNKMYRILKAATPGAYTFLLTATKEVPKRLQHPKRKTIGIRVPNCKITQALLSELEEPLMSCSVQLPNDEMPVYDPDEIYERVGHVVDLVIDGGSCGIESTSVIDLQSDEPIILREGKGDISIFG